MPPAVRHEVLGPGAEGRNPAAAYIETGLRDGWLVGVQLDKSEALQATLYATGSRLHRGESECIAVGKVRGIPVILDDKEARVYAGTLAVSYTGTAGVLYEAYRAGELDYRGLEVAVRELASVLWLSPVVVAEILRRAREAYT